MAGTCGDLSVGEGYCEKWICQGYAAESVCSGQVGEQGLCGYGGTSRSSRHGILAMSH
jgi:hypothetical protein